MHNKIQGKDLKSHSPVLVLAPHTDDGERLDLPFTGFAAITCEHTNQKYQLDDDQLTRIS